MTTKEFIVYEQPVNEHIRVCLRLEHLFNQVLHFLNGHDSWESRACLAAILEILNILDRPDLKAKLVKELSRYSNILTKYAETPNIDKSKLSAIQHEMDFTLDQFHKTQGRLAQNLRDNDFLNNVRQYLLNPGGICSFDVPAYHDWLHLPPAERIANLTHWFSNLKVIQNAIVLSLRLIRQSSPPHIREAYEGFYQATLDSQSSCQLIRVVVAQGMGVYPEISVGRHGLSIRFYDLNVETRPSQTQQDVRFQLTCCVF